MNNKRVAILLFVTIVILAGISTSFAKVEYLGSLAQVYGTGSCDTCHVDGPKDGPRTAYGTLFENQTNHVEDPVAALKAIGAPPSSALEETGTSSATMTATTEVTAAATTTEAATTAAKSPGFGIIVSMVGLIAWALFERRKN